jgi:cobalt/nickel transport system permease protein
MHIPDGYLGPTTYASLWALTCCGWVYASRKVKQTLQMSQVPSLAIASAFCFLLMTFTIPLPGGTSGHICGAGLVAVLLGPWAAAIAVSIALIIQALVFGEGGLTALGANCFNIAIIGSLVSYGAYALVVKTGSFARRGDQPVPAAYHLAGVGIGAYLGMNAAALLTALELGIQPMLYPASSGVTGYFPFPLSVVLPAVMLAHLSIVGILESMVSVLVLFFLKAQPQMAKKWNMSKIAPLVLLPLLLMILLMTPLAQAHEYWVESKDGNFTLIYGHGANREEFDASKVKSVKAYGTQSQALEIQSEKRNKGLLIKASEKPAVILVEVDNGYWSKTIYGWKELPKRKASRVVEAIRSFNYTKALLAWSDAAKNPYSEMKLDIVPLKNPFELKPGEPLPVKVIREGKPVPGVEVEGADHAVMATTGADGISQVKIGKGLQVITVTYKEPIKNDPDADFFSITTTLSFEAAK